jgi:hypothetical protein
MEASDIEWISQIFDFFPWMVGLAASALSNIWRRLVEIQSQYPHLLSTQTLFGLVGSGIGVWKWWEGREANLFRRFETMIERQEARLVRACTDLVDVMNRPGPGLLIRLPLFVEKSLRHVLARRRWTPTSLWPLPQATDRRLEATIRTCDRKVTAHLDRLALFRKQIASARLIQGALAAGRSAGASEEHESQRFDQEALDHFRAVLALPGHKEDLAALELMAHQLARLDGQSQSAASAYIALIDILEAQHESPVRNRLLGRAKRCLAILRYQSAPRTARDLLDDAINLLTQFGPPRDRDLLELAETVHLSGTVRLRLNMTVQGPQQLSLAQGHYRDLLRYLRSRRRGLFRWMLTDRRFAGHRIAELQQRTQRGLAQVELLIKLNERHQGLLIKSLGRGNGASRRNRKPLN